MTGEEMREKVARAACDAVNGDGAYDETGTLHREKVWHPVADAAIAIIRGETLEEAAKVAEDNEPEPSKEEMDDSYDAVAAYRVGRWEAAGDIATAIRALKEGK